MLKELIKQRKELDVQIEKTRKKEGKVEIKKIIKHYGLTPEYIAQLAERLKQRKAKNGK